MIAMTTPTVPERFHPRVGTDLMLSASLGAEQLELRARDLSMAGVFLDGYPLDGPDRLMLLIPVGGDRRVMTGAQVVRRTGGGAGVAFDPLDWDDLLSLARFLHPRLP